MNVVENIPEPAEPTYDLIGLTRRQLMAISALLGRCCSRDGDPTCGIYNDLPSAFRFSSAYNGGDYGVVFSDGGDPIPPIRVTAR